MYLFFSVFFVVLLLFFFLNHFRKKRIIRKVCSMSEGEKCKKLNSLIEPFGYWYDPTQDIFSSTIDAWQKEFGYSSLYDRFAAHFHMVYDCLPVYFDYQGKTWLIEFWKGQYGINAGGEIGIYCADELVPEDKRRKEFFHAVPECDMPVLSLALYQRKCAICSQIKPSSACPVYTGKEELIAHFSMRHWWLTAFRLGSFVWPYELFLRSCITFPNCEMMNAFLDALSCIDTSCLQSCVHCTQVCLTLDKPVYRISWFQRLVRKTVQWKNHLFCVVYLWVTRPFCTSMDRLLYLYYYLPFAFRRMIQVRKFKRRHKRCKRRAQKKKARAARKKNKY